MPCGHRGPLGLKGEVSGDTEGNCSSGQGPLAVVQRLWHGQVSFSRHWNISKGLFSWGVTWWDSQRLRKHIVQGVGCNLGDGLLQKLRGTTGRGHW